MGVGEGVELLAAVPEHPADPIPVDEGGEGLKKAVLLLELVEDGLGVLPVDVPHVEQGDELPAAPAVEQVEPVQEVVGDGAPVVQIGPQVVDHQAGAGEAQLLHGVTAHLVKAGGQTL